MGKEGYYALGGTALGALAGYVFGKGSGSQVSVPKDIAIEAAKISAFSLPVGQSAIPLAIKPIYKYINSAGLAAVMYALLYVADPTAVMSVWISGTTVNFEFGMQGGWDLAVYRGTSTIPMIQIPASMNRVVTLTRT